MIKILTEIDTSYWNTKDKAWKAERNAMWPKIDLMLSIHKPRKAINIIKAYYLRGKMPNWKALEEWIDERRHVDLFIFLWLHPSWDEAVLKELRDAYINSKLIIRNDIASGFSLFLASQSILLAQEREAIEQFECPYIEGHGELMFRIMFGDPIETLYEIKDTRKAKLYGRVFKLHEPELTFISTMTRWLIIKKMLPINYDYLYQYDQPLEWWYQCCALREDQFDKAEKSSFRRALYRIHHFDIEKEGDTNRSRFVHKLRQMLDEREFVAEFKRTWELVKADKIVVDDPWKP